MKTISEYANENNINDININIFEQYTTYWNRNKSKLGNYFWRDIVLVGSFLLGALTIPMIGLFNSAFKSAKTRKYHNGGIYDPYDEDVYELIKQKNPKLITQMTIGKIDEKKFNAYIDLSTDEKTNISNFANIVKTKNDYLAKIKNNKQSNIVYIGGFLNKTSCFMLGFMIIGCKTVNVNGKDVQAPIIVLEIDNTTENIEFIIEQTIIKLSKDKELQIQNGAYLNILNLEHSKDKKISDSLIKNLGFEKDTKDKNFNNLYLYTKAKHEEAKRKKAKEEKNQQQNT